MDDVARELSISKKTLYQYVGDKDDLVRKTLLLHIQTVDCSCFEICESESNAILQILKIADKMISMHQEMNPALLFDLKKYHTEIFQIFSSHRENTIQKQLDANLRLGISQKLYRPDINIELTTGFYMALIGECISSELHCISNVPFTEKYAYAVRYHLHAICTPLGIGFMNQNLSNSHLVPSISNFNNHN